MTLSKVLSEVLSALNYDPMINFMIDASTLMAQRRPSKTFFLKNYKQCREEAKLQPEEEEEEEAKLQQEEEQRQIPKANSNQQDLLQRKFYITFLHTLTQIIGLSLLFQSFYIHKFQLLILRS